VSSLQLPLFHVATARPFGPAERVSWADAMEQDVRRARGRTATLTPDAHPDVTLAADLRAFGLNTPTVAAAEALLARGERSLELSSILRCELLALLPRGPMPPGFQCDGVLWDERSLALDERIVRIGGDR
jgi:hypothetical protein